MDASLTRALWFGTRLRLVVREVRDVAEEVVLMALRLPGRDTPVNGYVGCAHVPGHRDLRSTCATAAMGTAAAQAEGEHDTGTVSTDARNALLRTDSRSGCHTFADAGWHSGCR